MAIGCKDRARALSQILLRVISNSPARDVVDDEKRRPESLTVGGEQSPSREALRGIFARKNGQMEVLPRRRKMVSKRRGRTVVENLKGCWGGF